MCVILRVVTNVTGADVTVYVNRWLPADSGHVKRIVFVLCDTYMHRSYTQNTSRTGGH